MPLTGTHVRTLDEKQRLALPKSLRSLLTDHSETVYVTPEPDGVVGIYSEKEFHAKADRLAETTANAVDIRRFMRVYYSQAETCRPDGQGRVRIPERFIERGGLSGEVVVLGVGDHLEVWDAEVWRSTLDQLQDDFDRLADLTANRDAK